jgi:hypothetical protein
VLIDVAAYNNATERDIDGSPLDQTPVVGVDNRLDYLPLKVAFLAGPSES